MKNSLVKFAHWFCRQLTFNEFSSIVPLFHEILSGTKSGFDFKPEAKTENYRKFFVDPDPPLSKPFPPVTPKQDWKELKSNYEKQTGKQLKPVSRRGLHSVPEHCCCEHCSAPKRYLYLNDEKKGNQVRCKTCNSLSSTERIHRKCTAHYFCPHCGSAPGVWKETSHETIYKCYSKNCPHYLSQESKLTAEEKEQRKRQKFSPNYKLHYQYCEYHLKPEELQCHRPKAKTEVDLSRIHNSQHVVGLVLSLFANIGLSSRLTHAVL